MDITKVLKTLTLPDIGTYENQFYILPIKDSNEYAEVFSHLDKVAVNTEFPNFSSNTNNTLTKAVNYFELTVDNTTYNLFLIADLGKDEKYYLKIGEK